MRILISLIGLEKYFFRKRFTTLRYFPIDICQLIIVLCSVSIFWRCLYIIVKVKYVDYSILMIQLVIQPTVLFKSINFPNYFEVQYLASKVGKETSHQLRTSVVGCSAVVGSYSSYNTLI